MTVPDRPTSPAQQYRLTNKGRAAIAPDDNGYAVGEAEDDGGGQVGGQVGGQAEGQAGGQEGQAALSTKAIAMLQVCLDELVIAEALMAAAGHASRTGQFRRCLHRLLRDGLLELTVPGKPRSPVQKYRLTEKDGPFSDVPAKVTRTKVHEPGSRLAGCQGPHRRIGSDDVD